MFCRTGCKNRGESRSNRGAHHEPVCAGAMTDDGVLHANRAVAQNDFRARIGPIRFEVVLRGGKSDKQYRDRGGPARDVGLSKIRTRGRDLHLPSKIPTGKEYRLSTGPSSSATISRLIAENSRYSDSGRAAQQ